MASALRSRLLGLPNILLVLFLIALTAQFCVQNLGDSVQSSQQVVARIHIIEFRNALELFRLDVGRYLTTQEGLASLIRNPGTVEGWHGPYLAIKEIPADPWGHLYVYCCPGENGSYDLLSFGRDGKEGGNGEDRDVTFRSKR